MCYCSAYKFSTDWVKSCWKMICHAHTNKNSLKSNYMNTTWDPYQRRLYWTPYPSLIWSKALFIKTACRLQNPCYSLIQLDELHVDRSRQGYCQSVSGHQGAVGSSNLISERMPLQCLHYLVQDSLSQCLKSVWDMLHSPAESSQLITVERLTTDLAINRI